MKLDLERYKELADNKAKENKAFVTRLRKKKPKTLDNSAYNAHVEAFEKIDCLECANCCKSISPIVIDRDIDRIAKHLKMKRPDVIDQYFEIDEDQDYVFKETPCPFLMPDNYCIIYEARPRACREYPHTDRKRFYQILNLTHRNSFVCPAVYEVLESLKKEY
ncbi:YkgJ family cysteine cluster protein [Labilibacter marinus]|uniref:YkgJ family cysteine cluster protein n=1 Tax=Labilibacter marinus TaxID=1477105 RepID=UPI00082E1C5B|nr:YkgJ family cysteine cluster protein [Labilibacter marinus]